MSTPLPAPASVRHRDVAMFVVAAMVLLALWPLVRPYDWLNRDAQLYALQAVAHAQPERYANDLFFLFGSQDRFTVVSQGVGPLFAAFGVERAAAWLTILASLAWWIACFVLARGLFGVRTALAAVVVVMVLPGWYGGGGGVFRYAETYFSARLPAEALVLLSLGLQMRGRHVAAAVSLLMSMFVHPLMTVPGIALYALMLVPRRRWPALVGLGLGAFGAAMLVAAFAPIGRLRVVDPQWLDVIATRSSFLFPTQWRAGDWAQVCFVGLMLVAAVCAHEDARARRLALGSIVIGAGGLAIAWLGSDVLPIELVLQGQPWRVMWLVTVVAMLMLPSTALLAWRRGGVGRVAALLLLTSCCSINATSDLAATAGAVACLLIRREPSPALARILLIAGSIALAATVTANLLAVIDVIRVPVFGGIGDARLERARNVAAFVVPVMLVALALGYLTMARKGIVALASAGTVALAMLVFVWRPAAAELNSGAYDGARKSAFAGWRARIPEGTNVLWATAPVAVWYLLERPSYISISQLAGVVFSRELALEGAARAERLRDYLEPGWVLGDPAHSNDPLKPLTMDVLRSVCAVPEIGFVVSGVDVPGAAVATQAWPDSTHYVHLYDCSRLRAGGS